LKNRIPLLSIHKLVHWSESDQKNLTCEAGDPGFTDRFFRRNLNYSFMLSKNASNSSRDCILAALE
jgi:hypothetical protein